MTGPAAFVARQLREPSGIAGRAMGPLLARANRRVNDGAVARLRLSGEVRVLEIGFGSGYALRRILMCGDGPAAGVERSTAMLAHARRRLRRESRRGRLDLRRGDAMTLPYADGRFDRVLASQTIYFWPDVARGLSEIHRVLAPGGLVVIAVEMPDMLARHAYARHEFEHVLGGRRLAELLADAGFVDIAIERDCPHLFASATRPPTPIAA